MFACACGCVLVCTRAYACACVMCVSECIIIIIGGIPQRPRPKSRGSPRINIRVKYVYNRDLGLPVC